MRRADNMRRGPVVTLTDVAFQRTDGPVRGPAPPAERAARLGDHVVGVRLKPSTAPRWACPGDHATGRVDEEVVVHPLRSEPMPPPAPQNTRIGASEINGALNHASRNYSEHD